MAIDDRMSFEKRMTERARELGATDDIEKLTSVRKLEDLG